MSKVEGFRGVHLQRRWLPPMVAFPASLLTIALSFLHACAAVQYWMGECDTGWDGIAFDRTRLTWLSPITVSAGLSRESKITCIGMNIF